MKCNYCLHEAQTSKGCKIHESRCMQNPNAAELRLKISPKGKTYSAERKRNLSETLKKKYAENPESMSYLIGVKWSQEQKEKLSKKMIEIAKANPAYSSANVCGRSKAGEYKGIKFHSSWEIEIAKLLDNLGLEWTRPIEPISYMWEGQRSYFPDFFLPYYDLYIEVKGYETDRDLAKWKALPNLIVIKKQQLEKLRKNPTLIYELLELAAGIEP